MLKKVTTLSIPFVLFLTSCGGSGYSYKRPESIQEKIDRYNPSVKNTNQTPKFDVLDDNRSFRASRMPASASTAKIRVNNRRLYFLTLYSQYERLKTVTYKSSAPDINYCPAFHTSYLEHKEKTKKNVTKGAWKYEVPVNTKNVLSFYPELNLPASTDSLTPRVGDLILKGNISSDEAQVVISKAVDIHLEKVFHELGELCETGTSTNYYTYENLITHVKTKNRLSPNTKGIKTLFRTTLFSNMAIIESLKGKKRMRAPASIGFKRSDYDHETLRRLKSPWAHEYLKSLSSKRK